MKTSVEVSLTVVWCCLAKVIQLLQRTELVKGVQKSISCLKWRGKLHCNHLFNFLFVSYETLQELYFVWDLNKVGEFFEECSNSPEKVFNCLRTMKRKEVSTK